MQLVFQFNRINPEINSQYRSMEITRYWRNMKQRVTYQKSKTEERITISKDDRFQTGNINPQIIKELAASVVRTVLFSLSLHTNHHLVMNLITIEQKLNENTSMLL